MRMGRENEGKKVKRKKVEKNEKREKQKSKDRKKSFFLFRKIMNKLVIKTK